MTVQAKIRQLLFSASLAGAAVFSAGLCQAQEAPKLVPVADHGLRQVPTEATEATPPVVRRLAYQQAADVSGKAIRQVQHSQQQNAAQNRPAPKAEEKKPSFFGRIWGKLRRSDSNPKGLGAPPPKIPSPPPLTYSTKGGDIGKQYRPQGNARIPVQGTGLARPSNPNAQQGAPLIPGAQRQQPSGRAPGDFFKVPQQAPARPQPQRRADDGFINPFVNEGVAKSEATLLDLDSLIEGSPRVVAGSQNTISQSMQKQVESLVEEPSTDSDSLVYTQKGNQRPSGQGPYTGFRLGSETNAPTSQAPAVPVARIQPQRRVGPGQLPPVNQVESSYQARVAAPANVIPQPQTVAGPTTPPSAGRLPTVEDYTESTLQEPEMQLPIAVTPTPAPQAIAPEPIVARPLPIVADQEPQFESVPLLTAQDTQTSLPTVSEADPEPFSEELLKSEAAAGVVAVNSQPVSDEIVVAQQTIPAAEPVDEGRLKVLESKARREQQVYRIMARTGKTGFKGFCPVQLRDNRELIDSRREYKARFGLQTYYFSTPEAKSAFEANPTRYAPAAGGSDVVLLVNTGEEEPGNLDFSLWYQDRLYLFRSRETRQIFSGNPKRFANQY